MIDNCLNISEINWGNQINRLANNERNNENNHQDNNNKILNIVNKIKIIMLNSGLGLYNEKVLLDNLRFIISNTIFINNFINNNININNNNFLYQNYIINNINNIINNKTGQGQNNNSIYYFIKMKDLQDNQKKI